MGAKNDFPRGASTLYFVGSGFKEKCIEFSLMVGGSVFYHLVLRPKEYFRSRKRKKETKEKRPVAG